MNQNKKPFFLITIDAEGDNLWNKPKIITTNNAKFLSRFQLLCDSYGLKPTYLTNYEMACSDVFKEFGHDVISNNNLSVYHGNDNFITKKSLVPFKKSVGKVDVGCIPFAFIHYYPYLLDQISK